MSKKAKFEKEIQKNKFLYTPFREKILILNQLKYLKKRYKVSIKIPKIILINKKKIQQYFVNKLIKSQKKYCWNTNRSRSIYSFFGLCRNVIKKFAEYTYLPGFLKSSW